MRLIILLMLCATGTVRAADAPTSQPATQPAPKATPKVVAAARASYGAATKSADDDFKSACTSDTKKYLADLKAAFNAAMGSGNLDDSNALKAEIDRVSNGGEIDEGNPPTTTTAAARRRFDLEVKAADASRKKKDDEAMNRMVADLKKAVVAALKAKKLDEANQIQAEIDSLKSAPAVAAAGPAAVPAGAGVGAAVQAPAQGKTRLVNLLPLVDFEKDAVAGKWTRKPTSVLDENRYSDGSIRIRYEPGDEYDYGVEFTALGCGPRTWINLLIPHEGLAGEIANPNAAGSLSTINGWDMNGGVRTHGPFFEAGKSYKLVAQVRKDGVSVLLNDKLISQAKMQPGNQGGPSPAYYTGDKTLGFATHNAQIELHSLAVQERGNPGTVITFQPLGDVPSLPQPIPTDKPKRVVDLLKLGDASSFSLSGNWTMQNGGSELVSDAKGTGLLRFPYHPPEEYDYRVSFTRISSNDDVCLILSKDASDFSFWTGGWDNTISGLGLIDNKYPTENQTRIRTPATITNGRTYAEVVYVRKNYVAASVDGKLVTRYATDYSDLSNPKECAIGGFLGLRTAHSQFVFHSVEVAEISGKGETPSVAPASEGASTSTHATPAPTSKSTAVSNSRSAVAFAIAPDLLVTSAAVKNATKISIEKQDGTRMEAKVIQTDDTSELSLLKVDGGKLPSLRLAESVDSTAISCLGFPEVKMFNAVAQSMPVKTGEIADPWTVQFEQSPRLPGGPLMQGGAVVGVELGDGKIDLSAVPAATLKSLRSLVDDSANATDVATDPSQAVFQLTAQVPDAAAADGKPPGAAAHGTSVVYLCGGSGSMLTVFPALKMQLKMSINTLDEKTGQEFNVVFYRDGASDTLFQDGTHPATADAKRQAIDFIDREVASGSTEPVPAIKFSLAEKPDLLYVLSNGFDNVASVDEVYGAFKDGNVDGKTHVNCIFLESDEDPKLPQVMKQIAKEGHGDFKAILKSDL